MEKTHQNTGKMIYEYFEEDKEIYGKKVGKKEQKSEIYIRKKGAKTPQHLQKSKIHRGGNSPKCRESDLWSGLEKTSQESMPSAWFCFAVPASSMDSGLARGSAPWTPGGYIPVANMLFIPVPSTFFISVPSTFFIPVPSTFFIPVPYILFIPVANTYFIPVSHILFIPVSNTFLSQSATHHLSQ